MQIYVDHAATTRLRPEVLEVMLPYYRDHFGNPSSLHSFGRKALAAMQDARDGISEALSCAPSEIIFTSGGTESDSLAILGVARGNRSEGQHIITTQIEHQAVLQTCAELEMMGFDVTYLSVDSYGCVSVEQVEQAIRPDTILITVMTGNNEVGTIQPIDAIGQVARARGILFHTDAVQALGTIDIDLSRMPVDLASFSAHKIGGPKGTGCLYVRRGVKMQPILFGGSQERKIRPGTENVAGICGMAKAVKLAVEGREKHDLHMMTLRASLLEQLAAVLDQGAWRLNSPSRDVLPHIVNLSFPGISTESLLMNLDLEGIAASSGSACTSGSLQVSHVLKAMHLPGELCHSAVRFSFGFTNCSQDVQIMVDKLKTILDRIRNK